MGVDMITALLIGAGALWLLGRKDKGIGKVERIKRRIYKEVSLAQDAGVDFSRKFQDLTGDMRDAIIEVGQSVGWKQSKRSIESGKTYAESYYGSLRRAWNAVSGVQGIGRAYDVRNADGDVVLTWNDVTEHVQQEPDAHVLLALPPHVEQKAPKAKKAKKDEEYEERLEFAYDFLAQYVSEHGEHAEHYLDQKDPDGTTIRDLIVHDFASGKLKVRDKNNTAVDVFINGEWNSVGTLFVIASELLESWRTRGLRSDNLDDVRRELLQRAKFMAVSHDGSPFGAPIQGDDRYNYLDKINWIVVTNDYYDNGEKTTYPYRAFDSEWAANLFKDSLYRQNDNHSRGMRRQYKVLPITEFDFEKITGLL